ncbi:helix-turn-helix transcriptional regulator [Bacillus glycinifermentans]|uniref:helix-turn-helix transcriptional regulator n=1 Tax=Bacillus glycinifermentans TaxID=1664069 RepID=UPI001583159D|nr:helix-turn-helix transcriptional regulator [Bacillus glycinifermentans]NUJ19326.1 helix-turn-helix transcriptional regulator [Bacillus glycinifermentans]
MNKNSWIKEYRKQKHFNHAQVALKAGIERSYYTKIENGQKPSVNVAQKLGKVLDFDWTLFFTQDCDVSSQKSHTA